ncbi:NERD domain-containing protein [Desertibacillus haloalkaliphilus]|uniref:NERD domain-containing protein n=1 Tax=Desertibacillus haloalkaliphilus TaxID=1328930 RepID=UPI001C27C21D|nr:NERD domain-containing protein [Desertibacillus haloalkaliphilus]MBU8905257.1 NERD domain-containing protein [Desertibacillus haloalkaliphilus]
MAHLIKLEDYISRYQFDITRYPSQFTRLKKDRWYYLKTEWENVNHSMIKSNRAQQPSQEEDWFSDESKGIWSGMLEKIKGLSFLKKTDQEEVVETNEPVDYYHFKEKTLDEVKAIFYQELFESQLRWASSSILEKSSLDPKYKYDRTLKLFVQQLPDNYLVMYQPVFWFKQARVEMEVIVISPTDVYCIALLPGTEHSIFTATSQRFWEEFIDGGKRRKLSPLLSLNRMASLISQMMRDSNLSMPIRKVVLSEYSLIDNQMQGSKVECVDRRNIDDWLDKLKRQPSPIKSTQLQVAKALLSHCQTSAYKRQDVVEE